MPRPSISWSLNLETEQSTTSSELLLRRTALQTQPQTAARTEAASRSAALTRASAGSRPSPQRTKVRVHAQLKHMQAQGSGAKAAHAGLRRMQAQGSGTRAAHAGLTAPQLCPGRQAPPAPSPCPAAAGPLPARAGRCLAACKQAASRGTWWLLGQTCHAVLHRLHAVAGGDCTAARPPAQPASPAQPAIARRQDAASGTQRVSNHTFEKTTYDREPNYTSMNQRGCDVIMNLYEACLKDLHAAQHSLAEDCRGVGAQALLHVCVGPCDDAGACGARERGHSTHARVD